jgi:Spy/CpxP family protein refolding chaperone
MNPWKPTALVLAGALVLTVGYHAASASTGTPPEPPAPGYHRMEMALMHLREGRNLLENAEHNHSGWKDRAIQHADIAIHETERAMEWAER